MGVAEVTRPLIGLTGRRKIGGQVAGFPASLAQLALDVFVADYARGVLEAGGLPVFLPLDAPSVELVDRLDGVVLTGGADLDRALYERGAANPTTKGAEPESDLSPAEPDRDRFELSIVDRADERDLPVLGICRGMQLLNVRGGGSLQRHVPSHARFDDPAHTVAHELDVAAGTRLHELCGDRLLVNSLHHQTVDRLAPGWVAAATASDGTVEAIELPGRDVLGVQWHPEMLLGRADDPLLAWIVERAAVAAERSNHAPDVA